VIAGVGGVEAKLVGGIFKNPNPVEKSMSFDKLLISPPNPAGFLRDECKRNSQKQFDPSR
jgi:hypothetical protein